MKALIFALCATPVAAQTPCNSTTAIHDRLANVFQESRSATGIVEGSEQTYLLEIWGNEQTGTFTVLMTYPNGLSCVVTAGQAFRQYQPEPNL